MPTKIDLDYPYSKDWKFGYIVTNGENRKTVILYNNPESRSSTAYARYLMSVSIGRYLTDVETVDHINHDKTDDRLENLQILTVAENNIKEAKRRGRVVVEYICPVCNNIFTRRKGNSNRIPCFKNKIVCCNRICKDKLLKMNIDEQQREKILSEQFIAEFKLHE